MNKSVSWSIQMVLGAVLVLSAPSLIAAPKKNNQQLSDDVAAMQQSLSKINRDMDQLKRLLDNRAMLELFQRMDELAQEVSTLNGMLEQQSHDIAGIKKRQRELYLDIDRRLRELEMTSSRPAQAPAPVVPTQQPVTVPPVSPAQQTAAPATAANQQAPVQQAAPVTTTPQVAKPSTITSATKPSVTVSEEREAYQKAFDMLKEGRYKMANASFKEFIGRFPQSNFAGNAQYWLGESNYVTRKFEQAVVEFQSVLKNYPTSNKVPDAMLKLGYTYYELRQYDNAHSILGLLQKRYPQSSAARLAKKRLDRMKKESR